MSINQNDLLSKSSLYANKYKIFESTRSIKTGSILKSAFLCHSHKDDDLVKGLLVLFRELGVELYIDWKDHSMPETPNIETAMKIQKKIRSCDVFIFLATGNSKSSRWCPWEIGYGDSSSKKIYIIPTRDSRDDYGNEYLALYPKIDIGRTDTMEGLAIFKPGGGKGEWLSESIL